MLPLLTTLVAISLTQSKHFLVETENKMTERQVDAVRPCHIPGRCRPVRVKCSVDNVKEIGVTPTSVTIVWSSECPEDQLNYWKFYVEHQDYNACDDKTKSVKLLVPKERDVSAREVILNSVNRREASHATTQVFLGDNKWAATVLQI